MLKAKKPIAHEAINITVDKLSTSSTTQFKFYLKDTSTLNNPEYYCNKCNNQQNVNDASGAVGKKSYRPGDYQNYCDDVK